MGGREGGGEKSVSAGPKHRAVPTPLLTKFFPGVSECENRYRIIFKYSGALQGGTARKDPS
jgi:hypothetical protein